MAITVFHETSLLFLLNLLLNDSVVSGIAEKNNNDVMIATKYMTKALSLQYSSRLVPEKMEVTSKMTRINKMRRISKIRYSSIIP